MTRLLSEHRKVRTHSVSVMVDTLVRQDPAQWGKDRIVAFGQRILAT